MARAMSRRWSSRPGLTRPTNRPAARVLQVTMSVVEPAEAYLYRPARMAWLSLARIAKRLQSGRLDAYIAYMLVALLAVLATVAVLR